MRIILDNNIEKLPPSAFCGGIQEPYWTRGIDLQADAGKFVVIIAQRGEELEKYVVRDKSGLPTRIKKLLKSLNLWLDDEDYAKVRPGSYREAIYWPKS